VGDIASDQDGHLADEIDRNLMLSGREAALFASHVIDDLVLPINCIDQQGRLAVCDRSQQGPLLLVD